MGVFTFAEIIKQMMIKGEYQKSFLYFLLNYVSITEYVGLIYWMSGTIGTPTGHLLVFYLPCHKMRAR